MTEMRHRDDNQFTHVGICVSDLDRSLAFYCRVLAFDEVGRHIVNDVDSSRMLEVEGLDLELVFIERDGIRLELLGHRGPGHLGDGKARPMNQLGLTHLCFRVGDLDEVCRRIVDGGGTVVPGTSAVVKSGARGIMTLDPDGVRIELIERTA